MPTCKPEKTTTRCTQIMPLRCHIPFTVIYTIVNTGTICKGTSLHRSSPLKQSDPQRGTFPLCSEFFTHMVREAVVILQPSHISNYIMRCSAVYLCESSDGVRTAIGLHAGDTSRQSHALPSSCQLCLFSSSTQKHGMMLQDMLRNGLPRNGLVLPSHYTFPV